MHTRPNLVFVFPDEFRPYSIGCRGREKVKTPNLDRFAAESTVFTNVASNYPVCSPYRAVLFTGKYPYKNGVTGNCNSAQPSITLPEDSQCLSDRLAALGYSTGYIGKWHLQAPRPGDERYGEGPRGDGRIWDTYTPPGKGRHGFDFWYSYGCCDNHNDPHYWTGNLPIDRPIRPREWSAKHETDVAIDYLTNASGVRDPEAPFALFVAYNPPHMPFNQVPDIYKNAYADFRPADLLTWQNLAEEGRNKAEPHVTDYFAMITGVDDQFGRILRTIDAEPWRDNTIVVFTSDHGEMMGSHGLMHKNVWQNESFLVPFIVRYPDTIRSGATDDAVFSTIDLYPSLLGLMGLGASIPAGLDGKDISRRMVDGTSADAGVSLYIQVNQSDSTSGLRGFKDNRYTFVLNKTRDGIDFILIDNSVDPDQLVNVYGQDPDLDRAMKKRLRSLLESAEDPFRDIAF